METFELERMCRLCGKQLHNTMAIHIFKNKGNYEKKIRTVLPIMIHEMDCLPKYLCYDCGDKLQELYEFYFQTLKFDIHMKNQLSWMQNEPDVKSDIIPTVYFADLRSIKIHSELENLEKFYASKDNTNFDLINSSNADSVKKTHDNIDNDELNRLPMFAAYDINQDKHKKENNQLPFNVTTPLFRINNDLPSNYTVETLNSKNNFINTMKRENEISCKKFLHNDGIINTTTNATSNIITDDDNNRNDSYNCHVALAKVLIKSETKENDEFIRKLRPRRKIINGKPATQIKKKMNNNKSSSVSRNNKSIKLMSDSKLSKKVEIKVEKLECEALARSVEAAAINTSRNESRKIDDNYSSNMQYTMKKPKLEIADNIMGKIKPLRTQNYLKDMVSYRSKIELHMKDPTVKLTKINVAQLKKPGKTRKIRNKISKITKAR
ncbi:hypothetical protein PV328_004517 [Microctonus aethiopoides]|uniref:ZAD domain-containing protein n=1 Tax=Microctonus aethiopoides TaxID=144406 RepID=A0AA39FAY6_9HYME|nr:hypothetical protein PV328_004517 [Microctonus aethiopoides]